MTRRRTLSLAALLIGAAACVWAVSAGRTGWGDVLDTPSLKSPLASRTLLNGLAAAGQRLVAVGQRGHALFSDDLGATWQQAEVPVSSDLVAVSFPDAKHGWAVGHDGVILHSVDGGGTWQRQLDGRQVGALMVEHYDRQVRGAPDEKAAEVLLAEAKRFEAQGAENPFLDVWFENANSGYAVGAFGLILRTTDGGATWEPWLHAMENPKGLHLYAIRAVGKDVYIVGEQGLVLKHDAALGRFRGLDFPYKGTLFGVVGTDRAVVVYGLRGTAMRSGDGGSTWQSVTTGVQAGLTAGSLAADGRIVLVSQAGHVLSSRDEGASFSPLRVERPTPAAAVWVAGTGALVVAGPRGVQILPPR